MPRQTIGGAGRDGTPAYPPAPSSCHAAFVISRHQRTCHAMLCHAMVSDYMAWHGMGCDAMRRVIPMVPPNNNKSRACSLSCGTMPCGTMPCHAMPCYLMAWHVMACHAMPCYWMEWHVMACTMLHKVSDATSRKKYACHVMHDVTTSDATSQQKNASGGVKEQKSDEKNKHSAPPRNSTTTYVY